jgi:hypothetical protein
VRSPRSTPRAPEIVADAIVCTVEHPRREVAVGGASIGIVPAQRLSPALADAVLSIPLLGVSESKADRPDNRHDNVDGPMDEPGQVHGSYPGPVLRHSTVTAVLARVPRAGDLLTGALPRCAVSVAAATQRRPAHPRLEPRTLSASPSSARGSQGCCRFPARGTST